MGRQEGVPRASRKYCLYLCVCVYVCVFETGSPYVANAALELSILLPQPPEYWDYSHVPPHWLRLYLLTNPPM
jgi:hypothetical protein